MDKIENKIFMGLFVVFSLIFFYIIYIVIIKHYEHDEKNDVNCYELETGVHRQYNWFESHSNGFFQCYELHTDKGVTIHRCQKLRPCE